MRNASIPYGELDPAIVPLCRLLNDEFPGIQTSESCQGFVDGHQPGKPWGVYFRLDRRIRHVQTALDSLELLAWMVNSDLARARPEWGISLGLNAAPPTWNYRPLYFWLHGESAHPDDLVGALGRYLVIVRRAR
jgi:hypothetical protein